MFRIRKKELLSPNVWLMQLEARRIAESALPGQFLIVRAHDKGERIPLTIAGYDRQEGLVDIVTQVAGHSTGQICHLEEGDSLLDCVGPLGRPSDLCDLSDEALAQERVIFVGGGVGAAPILPQVKYMAERGVRPDVLIGARGKEQLILQEELSHYAGHLYQATNDGSAGKEGLVTDYLRELVEKDGHRYSRCVTIGPMIMMKFVAALTRELGIPTIASLNTLMVDGTGMCGACRVTVDGKMRFTCVDGPEFDAHKLDFNEALRRQGMYRDAESRANAADSKGEGCLVRH